MPDARRLTLKHAAVLDFMRAYQAENDNMPTMQTIARHFGFTSPNAITHYLQALEFAGHIEHLTSQVGYRFTRSTPCASAVLG